MKTTVRAGRAMGSPLRLTLPGVVEDPKIDAAWHTVRGVFGVADHDLTRFDAASPLSQLNRASGSSVPVPRTLARALTAAWRAFRHSGGRFDPRIIGALERAGERAGVVLPPSPPRLCATDRWLWLDARRGEAAVAAPVDLGGIGKGLALRWAATALRRAGHRDFLIQAGGDIVAAGIGPAARPWVVGLSDPTGGPPSTIALRDAALATSSTAVRRWRGSDGILRHHLIDPSTLEPAPTELLSVTVRHEDPAWAEVLAKVGFIAGSRVGASLEGETAWWHTDDGRFGHTTAVAQAPSIGMDVARC